MYGYNRSDELVFGIITKPDNITSGRSCPVMGTGIQDFIFIKQYCCLTVGKHGKCATYNIHITKHGRERPRDSIVFNIYTESYPL